MMREEQQLKKKIPKQKEINNILYNICLELKTIPNIHSNYLEYTSALIYVLYEKQQIFNEILEKKEKNIEYLTHAIDNYLHEIRFSHNQENLFINIKFNEVINKEYYNIIWKVITKLNQLILNIENNKKILAEAFEYIIMISAENNDLLLKNGEFYTPKSIIDTMLNLVAIKNKMAIYNPASGTGDFIVESAKYADIYAFGEETNISNYNLCMTNIWLHDISNIRIQQKQGEIFKLADLAIGNPPFVGRQLEDIQNNCTLQSIYYHHNISPTASTYTKFLVMMLESVNEHGKISVILPLGFLFKNTKPEYYLRRELIEKNYIDAIIGLPEKLFYNTKIPVIILLIDKNRKKEGVLFIDASKEYVKKRRYNTLALEHQQKIINTYQNYKPVPNYSYVASLDEIIENKFDLNLTKYVHPKKITEEINPITLEKRIIILEQEKNKISQEINNLIKTINIKRD